MTTIDNVSSKKQLTIDKVFTAKQLNNALSFRKTTKDTLNIPTTGKEVAKKAVITEETFSSIKTGKSKYNTKFITVTKIANALSISPFYFTGFVYDVQFSKSTYFHNLQPWLQRVILDEYDLIQEIDNSLILKLLSYMSKEEVERIRLNGLIQRYTIPLEAFTFYALPSDDERIIHSREEQIIHSANLVIFIQSFKHQKTDPNNLTYRNVDLETLEQLRLDFHDKTKDFTDEDFYEFNYKLELLNTIDDEGLKMLTLFTYLGFDKELQKEVLTWIH